MDGYSSKYDNDKTSRPSFDALPLQPHHPKASAWGLWGSRDQLGTLNLLTEDVVRSAAAEIRDGLCMPLNLPLDVPKVPMNPARKPIIHNIIQHGYANDDEIHINTQASSQWDGPRHYPYQDLALGEQRFYNGAAQSHLVLPDGSTTSHIGIQNAAQRGIAGRGVLLDWGAYAVRNGIEYSPFTSHGIPLDELEAVAAEQGVEFRQGDILLIRTGWTEAYLKLSKQDQTALAARSERRHIGVAASKEMIQWHWDNAFAAVASDTNAYEAWPSTRPWGVSCHEVFLSGWAMPIGELFDLDRLAVACRKRDRWSFFFTASPLNLTGGVASPSNAMRLEPKSNYMSALVATEVKAAINVESSGSMRRQSGPKDREGLEACKNPAICNATVLYKVALSLHTALRSRTTRTNEGAESSLSITPPSAKHQHQAQNKL